MKKKVTALLLAVIMIFTVSGAAMAGEAQTRASHYLDSYYVTLAAKGSGKMGIGISVNGVDVEDKIGVQQIDIDVKVNGKWTYYDTLDCIDYPEFLESNTDTYINTVYFYGTPGDTYRVTLTAYAEKDGGWDTGYVTSFSAVCK